MRNFKLIVYLFTTVVVGCTKSEKPVASVNDVPIYREDIALRSAVYSECDGKTEIDTISVFAECIRDVLEKTVLIHKYGLIPSDSVMAKKVKWIDQNTKDPQRWMCIKSVYKGNREAFYRNVISPILVNQKLHYMFSLDTIIHKAERDSIMKIFEKVMQFPESLVNIEGYDTFNIKKEINVDKTLPLTAAESFHDPLIDKVLVHIKPGDIWRTPVENDYSMGVIRLVSENDSEYVCDGVVISKRSFNKWFQEYAIDNIHLEIYDNTLEKELLKKYPDLWWKKLIR